MPLKQILIAIRETVASVAGHAVVKPWLDGELEKSRKPREANQFERTLTLIRAEGSHGVRAARNIETWHERCQAKADATYPHPRTGRPFRYGPLYEDGASNALGAHLASLPNDHERVLYLLRFGKGTDRDRDGMIARLTNDRLFQLLDSGWELVGRAAQGGDRLARTAATEVDRLTAWGRTLPGGRPPANPNAWWRRVWGSWLLTLVLAVLVTAILLVLGARQ